MNNLVNQSLSILLYALNVYYCLYGLILFSGPLDPMSLQNPNTPIIFRIIDEAICFLLAFVLLFHTRRYTVKIVVCFLTFSSFVLLVSYFREIAGFGLNLNYLKSLIMSIIFLLAVNELELSKFLQLVRSFIHINAFAVILSVFFYITDPYVAYGGRLLGNYANPNTSSLVYAFLISVLLLVGKFLYSSFKGKNLIISLLILIFGTGLITSFSKFYILISSINLFIVLSNFSRILVIFVGIVSMLLMSIVSESSQIFDDLAQAGYDFLTSHTVAQRLLSYDFWLMEMNSAKQFVLGLECGACYGFVSDASVINITSSFGFFVGSILLSLPLVLIAFSAFLQGKYNRKIMKKYALVFVCCYLGTFFHYQVEIQPTQFIFFLAALAPMIFLRKIKVDNREPIS